MKIYEPKKGKKQAGIWNLDPYHFDTDPDLAKYLKTEEKNLKEGGRGGTLFWEIYTPG